MEVMPAAAAGMSTKRMSAIAAEDFVDYGSINFTMHNTTENAEFVLCRAGIPKDKLALHMTEAWELNRLGVLLRVTGANDPDLLERIETMLQGVVHAVSEASGAIFSNGLDFGLAAVVGHTISSERHRCQAPLVGVPSWSSVQGRAQLASEEDVARGGVAVKGLKRKYADAKPDDNMATVSLQPVHTHFVIVRGDDAALAREEGFSDAEKLFAARVRSFTFAHELEEELAKRARGGRTPRLLMVINGDDTTLSEVLTYARVGKGIVVLATQTGGLAAALAEYVRTGTVPRAWQASAPLFEELKQLNAEAARRVPPGKRRSSLFGGGPSGENGAAADAPSTGGSGGSSSLPVRPLANAPDWPLLALADNVTKRGITQAILDAAMRQAEDTPTRVRFAVEWHDAERLAFEFGRIPHWDTSRKETLRDALQLSLELQHERCVAVCIKNAAPVKMINLLGLYDLLFDEVHPPLIFLFKGKPKPTERLKAWKRGEREKGLAVNLDDPVFEFYPVEVWGLLESIVPGLCGYWRSKVAHLVRVDGAGSGYSRLSEVETTKTTGPRWLDVYVWAVLLGKTELALSLVTACREPMRAAVVGARLCDEMARQLPLHSVALEKASGQHELWAMGLLDLCESFEEAWRMLVTKSAVWTKPLLHMAVQSDLRPFCSHVQCQLLGDEWLIGNSDFNRPCAVLNGTDISTLRLYQFMFLPIDPPWLEPLMAWRVPLHMPTPQTDELQRKPPFWHFYSIPQVKIMVRFTTHLIYTVLISYATIMTPTTWADQVSISQNLHPHSERHIVSEEHEFGHDGGGLEAYGTDAFLWVWTLSLCCDEFFKYAQAPLSYTPDMWNYYDYMTFMVVQTSLFLRFLSIRGSVEGMCFAVVLVWCRLFKYLQNDYNLGVLVIILMRMMKDIAMWFTISAIVLVAFTVAFVSITNPYVVEDSGNHPVSAPIWALLGSYDLEEVHDWNSNIGKPMLWIYLVISNVMLVNLLIAMMGYTFSEVKDQADREWKFGRMRTIIEVTERFAATPPPFNFPQTLYTFVRFFYLKTATGSGTAKPENRSQAEIAELKEAKKLKGKVARRLLFALKRKEEDELDTVRTDVHDVRMQTTALLKHFSELNSKVSGMESRLESSVQELKTAVAVAIKPPASSSSGISSKR